MSSAIFTLTVWCGLVLLIYGALKFVWYLAEKREDRLLEKEFSNVEGIAKRRQSVQLSNARFYVPPLADKQPEPAEHE